MTEQSTNWKDLLEWCEKQGDLSCVPEIVQLLEHNPDKTGKAVAFLLWTEGTGEVPQATMEGYKVSESPEMVERFYRRFPSLPVMRPLAQCPVCERPTINLFNQIRELAECHDKTAGEIAEFIRSSWPRVYPSAKKEK